MLVSNCYDELRYACMSRPLKTKRAQKRIPSDSFQGTRSKHIRAKKYARNHGISVAEAWDRVR